MTLKGLHIVDKTLASGEKRTYFYAWRGGPRLEADPGDEHAFLTEWLRLTRGRAAPVDVETVSDLIKKYVASNDFTGLKERTQKDYQAAMDRIEVEFHDVEVAALGQRGARSMIIEWRDLEFASRKRTGDLTMAVLNKILNFALDREYITRNPIEKVAPLNDADTRRDIIWTDEKMKAFAASAPRHLVRAMILAKWTGQRQGDLLKLTWSAYDGSHLMLQQGKSGRGKAGRRVKILVSEELKLVLEEIRAEQIGRALPRLDIKTGNVVPGVPAPAQILTTADGAPWKSGFKASWSTAVTNAKIKGVTFHDFRGTFITLAHRSGASIKDIAEASGHDEKECERVIRQHYLATGADTVIHKLEKRQK